MLNIITILDDVLSAVDVSYNYLIDRVIHSFIYVTSVVEQTEMRNISFLN